MSDKKHISIKAHGASDIGRRQNNEDAWLINERLGLFIVADGMGGHDKGEVASWFTSANLELIIEAHSSTDGNATFDPVPASDDGMDFDELMAYAVMSVNRRLFERNEAEAPALFSSAQDDAVAAMMRKRSRMGTTLISILVREDRAYVSHVGDSRAYRISHGSIARLTHDHSWVEEQIRLGQLSPEEARTHAKRNVITRSVGFKPDVLADIDVLTLSPPERFLLCSDGLSNVVPEEDMLRLASIADLRDACGKLVNLAKANGGRDNITCVLIDVLSAPATARREEREFTDL